MFATSANTNSDNNDRTLFLTVLKEYMQKNVIENRISKQTEKKYLFFYNNIYSFLLSTDQLKLKISDVRIKIMEEMRFWIQTQRKCSGEHASRHIEICKRMMEYAVRFEYTLHNPISAVKAIRSKTKEVVNLEPAELQKLHESKFEFKSYNEVVDLYLFQSYTGLSYADLYSFEVIEKENRLWIANRRAKNDTPYYVPLFDEAKIIYEKYEGNLPFVVNQSYNRWIKEIAAILNIKKYLTTHTARKTFATTMDSRGWSTKTIADMMGNTQEVLQKHYLAKSTKRIENEMLRLSINS